MTRSPVLAEGDRGVPRLTYNEGAAIGLVASARNAELTNSGTESGK